MEKLKQNFRKSPWYWLFPRLLSCWLLASTVTIIAIPQSLNNLDFVKDANLLLFAGTFVLLFLTISLIHSLTHSPLTDNRFLLGSSCAFVFATVFWKSAIVGGQDFYYTLGVLLILAFIGYYVSERGGILGRSVHLRLSAAKKLILIFAILYTIYVGGLTALRYLTYHSPTFDFSIFCQMFYNMKEIFLPVTTCERDMFLSHFAVHISPIYYLLLPFYFIFPSPVCLQIMQAVVLASGVIPLYLLAKKLGFPPARIAIFCALYCASPSIISGCFYDIHENMFLAPLILWLFYFFETKRWTGVYIFALLTLMVKEDAALYIACIGLYFILSNKSIKHGIIVFGLAVIYFCTALYLLNTFGLGAMVSRFGNLLPTGESGLFSVAKSILINPAYTIQQIFTSEKLQFVLLLILPLGVLPLLNKKTAQLVLLIPIAVINLLPDYPYQYDINFQYHFGVTAIFFYLSLCNLKEFSPKTGKRILSFALACAVIFSVYQTGGRLSYVTDYIRNFEDYRTISELLETIPQEASIQASPFFTAKLSSRAEVYELPSKNETEYIAIDLRPGFYYESYQEAHQQYLNSGYESICRKDGLVDILKKTAQ